MKYVETLFDEAQVAHNDALRRLALDTEELVRADGYQIDNPDCNGLQTMVWFDTAEEMSVFRLKYMRYTLVPAYPALILHLGDRKLHSGIGKMSWLISSWVRIQELFRYHDLARIQMPRHYIDFVFIDRIARLIAEYDGVVVIDRNGNDYFFNLAFTDDNAAMFRLSV